MLEQSFLYNQHQSPALIYSIRSADGSPERIASICRYPRRPLANGPIRCDTPKSLFKYTRMNTQRQIFRDLKKFVPL